MKEINLVVMVVNQITKGGHDLTVESRGCICHQTPWQTSLQKQPFLITTLIFIFYTSIIVVYPSLANFSPASFYPVAKHSHTTWKIAFSNSFFHLIIHSFIMYSVLKTNMVLPICMCKACSLSCLLLKEIRAQIFIIKKPWQVPGLQV